MPAEDTGEISLPSRRMEGSSRLGQNNCCLLGGCVTFTHCPLPCPATIPLCEIKYCFFAPIPPCPARKLNEFVMGSEGEPDCGCKVTEWTGMG